MKTAALPILLLLTGCRAAPAPDPDLLRVAVSVGPQAGLVRKIGGDRVAVTTMLPPGASDEDVSLSPRQAVALETIQLYVAVGHRAFPLETRYIRPFLDRHPGVRVVDMSAACGPHPRPLSQPPSRTPGRGELAFDRHPLHPSAQRQEMERRGMERSLPVGALPSPGGAGGRLGEGPGVRAAGRGCLSQPEDPGDPHVWVSPEIMTAAARKVAAELAALDPAHAAEYQRNLAGFLDGAGRLDREVRERLSAPGGSRAFVVYHPSWTYFAERYGLEQIAIEAEGKEPGAARLIQIIDRARSAHARVVLVPEGFPRESAQVIADAIQGRIVAADPLAPDWEGTLRRVSEVLSHG